MGLIGKMSRLCLVILGKREGGWLFKQPELIYSLIFSFLMLNVCAYRFFIQSAE